MLSPKRIKYRKKQRGTRDGIAHRGNTVAFGEYGLVALEPRWITNRQIEAARVEDFTIQSCKTKDMAAILKNFVADEQRTVVIMSNDDAQLRRAARNIPYLHVLAYDKLSAKELLYGKKVLVLETAAKNLNEFYCD